MTGIEPVSKWVKTNLLTKKGRAGVYAALGALTAFLIAAGWMSADSADQWMDTAQKALAMVASVAALMNLTPDVETEDQAEDEK